MSLIYIAMLVSAGLIAGVYAISISPRGLAGACRLAATMTVVSFFLMSPAVVLQSLFTFFVAKACLTFNWGTKALLTGCVSAMIAAYLLAIVPVAITLSQRASLREQFPLMPLSDRLAYEMHKPPAVDSGNENAPLDENLEINRHFLEGRINIGYRADALKSLHDRTIDQFVVAQGFGPLRMAHVGSATVEVLESKPIPLPRETEYSPDDPKQLPLANDHGMPAVAPAAETLTAIHFSGLADFLNADRMGYVQDKEHVAGFLGHQFTQIPQADVKKQPTTAWQIISLELISLLKHQEPVAYVSENLPSMEELRNAPTRPLDSFEQSGLRRLRLEEDLVIDSRQNEIRMLGALRAATNCLACHSVQSGELLGAFSYRLTQLHAKPARNQLDPAAKPDQTWVHRSGDPNAS